MVYINRELKELIDDMEKNFSIPEDWNEYLYEIEKNHNIIVKTNESYYCTNCQQTFSAKTKIKNVCKCPYCKQKLMVRSNRLKWLEYKDNIMMLDNCNGHVILRLFEMKSEYHSAKQEFEHSTVEYARKLVDIDYRELRNDRISPKTTSFCVNHYLAHNGKWRLYDGWWHGSLNYGYLYKNNLEKVLKGTNLEKSRLWEAIREPYTRGYDIKDLLYQAQTQLFETLVELKLYSLAENASFFCIKGSFYKIFGIGKDYYEFMKKYNISLLELKVLREYPIKDIKQIRFLVKYANQLQDIKKYMSVKQFIEYFKNNRLKDSNLYLDYLRFARKLGYNLKDKKYLFPKNLKKMHDEYEKQIEVAKQEELNNMLLERSKNLSQNIYENKAFIIFPANSVQALIDESSQQHNCVRTYVDSYANGECDIYFMIRVRDKDRSLVTVEVKENKVVQQRICNNADTTKEQKRFLKEWEINVLSKVTTQKKI